MSCCRGAFNVMSLGSLAEVRCGHLATQSPGSSANHEMVELHHLLKLMAFMMMMMMIVGGSEDEVCPSVNMKMFAHTSLKTGGHHLQWLQSR